MALQIRKAQRAKAWLKVVIDGVSGSGKTYSALLIGRGLGPNPKVIMIDTENGSGELYSHLYDYDYIRIDPPFSPAKYIEAIDAAIAAGYDVILIDSLSHCWKYILSYKESLDASNPKNTWGNWAKAKALFDEIKNCLLQCPAHVITTLRASSEYAESYDAKGNKNYTKVGVKPIAEPDLEFEFTLALRIERSHLAIATKDRTEQFDIAAPFTPSVTTGRKLYDWLSSGAGDLNRAWSGGVHSEEAQNALKEAEKIGVGVEGSTEDELARKATELLNMKRGEAAEKIKALGLDVDANGLKAFKEKAKEAGLDPLEVFWEFSKKRDGLKTWAEYLLVLEEFVQAKADAEGNEKDEGPDWNGLAPTSNDTEKVPNSAESEKVSKASERLRKAFTNYADKLVVLKRADAVGVSVDDLIAEAVSRNLKAGVPQIIEALEEVEARPRES